ncbi:MAG: hypothetical protein WCD07_10165 [Burkholderiales bacterium]
MAQISNGDIERYYFEQFKNHYQLPDGNIEYSDKPDVIVNGQSKVGIELGRLYLVAGNDPNAEQNQRLRRDKVVAFAQKYYQKFGGRNIKLCVDFNPSYPINNIDNVAKSLVEAAKTISELTSGNASQNQFPKTPELRYINHNGKEYADAKWRVSQVHSVPNLSIARLKEEIEKKIEKLKSYQLCDSYWLLIIIDFMDRAQDQHVHWPANELVDRTPYEKILIYKPQFGQIFEVPQRKFL